VSKDDLKLKRAEAIIGMLRIFYPNQVERAERLCDLAMKTSDNTPVAPPSPEKETEL
jgi:hypothetical protein